MNVFQSIQHKLLLRYPLLWSSRVIPVLLTAGTANIFLFLFFYVVSHPSERMLVFVPWVLFFSLCSLIGVIFYLIFLLRFNYFKSFGKLKPFDFAFQFLLFFMSLGSIIAWPFMPRLAAHCATANKYSLTEMHDDFEQAYLAAYQLEYTRATAPYRKVHIMVVDSLEYPEEDGVNNEYRVPSEKDINPARYARMERLADGTIYGYERTYLPCSYYAYGVHDPEPLMDKIYASFPEAPLSAAEIAEREAKLNEIFAKYLRYYDGSIYSAPAYTRSDEGILHPPEENRVCSKYRLSDLGDKMGDIQTNMLDAEDGRFVFRIWFYLTLYGSLLLLIFRHMTTRTFLWTLLFTFLLFVFTVIFSVISSLGSGGVFALMLFYYLVFLGFAVSVFFARSRNVFQGIGLNLSFFLLQFVPVVFILLRYSVSDSIVGDYIPAEIIGIVLVVVSSLVFHSRLFQKWYALPEQ